VNYERNEQEFMRLVVRPGMHVADVGAHHGFHTTLLADLVGETGSVTAFEPLLEHASTLSAKICEHGSERRVTVVRVAVADGPGARQMVIAARGLASANAYLSGLTGDSPPNDVRGTVPLSTMLRDVPTVALDEALSDRRIGFVKIDAEGAEALVLRGAHRLLSDDRPVVLVDLHPHLMPRLDGTTPEMLIDEMRQLGYRCRLLGAGVPGPPITDVHAKGVTTVVFLRQ
jgi:FkbM family methyltransferase